MNIEKIKEDAIYSDNQSRLFEIIIELTEEISLLHGKLAQAKDHLDKIAIKGKISLMTELQKIIDLRLNEVRIADQAKERQQMIVNRQFKIIAEKLLKKETFERINELSNVGYITFKKQKSELIYEKLE